MQRSAEIIAFGESGPLASGSSLVAHRATGPELDYFAYVPRSATPASPLLISVHGLERQALQHAVRFSSLAEELNFIVLAPLFSKSRLPRYQRLERGPRGDCPMVGLDLTIDMFLRRIGGEAGPLRLLGYSGGAQFAMRYTLVGTHPVARLALAAPGWFTMPDPNQPFPYGLGPSEDDDRKTPDIGRLLSIPVLLTVGGDDVRRDSSLNRSSRIDREQGLNRVERARRWTAAMAVAARQRGWPERVDFRVIPGAGHDFNDNMQQHGLGETVANWLLS